MAPLTRPDRSQSQLHQAAMPPGPQPAAVTDACRCRVCSRAWLRARFLVPGQLTESADPHSRVAVTARAPRAHRRWADLAGGQISWPPETLPPPASGPSRSVRGPRPRWP
uniref:Uncharacterized protein n=1 Tax=Setaria italica TaxID=4555 RepID=K3Z1C8_SETIT